jgi:hypothetical protein
MQGGLGNSGSCSMRPTPFDWQMARRASVLAAILSLAMVAVVVSTDEQSVSWAARLGRLAPLLAVAGGLGAFVTMEQARARGEVRAIMALGVAPLRACAGAAVGGTWVALVGPGMVLRKSVDLGPLFPRAEAGTEVFRTLDARTVIETSRGVILHADGMLAPLAEHAPSMLSSTQPRLGTFLALLVLALAVPIWSALRCRPGRRIVMGALAMLGCMLVFHLVAAGRAPAWTLPLAPLVLLVEAVNLGYRQPG